jgi:DNA-binding PadR family transcriptional regulator
LWDNWRNNWRNWKNVHERIDKLHKLGGLRIWILHVLDHGPKNGVEIMDAIQEHQEMVQEMYQKRMHQFSDDKHDRHYNRHYNLFFQKTLKNVSSRPSPGSVYPMLKKMVDEGLISKFDDGKYDLTETGRQTIYEAFGGLRGLNGEQMDRGGYAIENALTEIDNYVSYLEDIKKEKIAPHEELIGNLSERLKKLKESLHED